MKKNLFIATLIACGPLFAATPIDGLYSGVVGGYNYLTNNLNVVRGGRLLDATGYNESWHAGVRFGYQSNPIRYEFEYTYLRAKLDGFAVNNITQIGVNGDITSSFVFMNVYYDLPDMLPDVAPFLGAGIGYAFMKGRYTSAGPFFSTAYRPSDTEFAYQATTGLTYNFSENYSANIAYRYLITNRAGNFGRALEAHLGSVGIVYRFDKARYT